jgi:integrase
MSIPSADTAAATKSKPNTKEQHLSPDGKWQSSPKVPRLMQYVPSGMYFARVRHNGKLFRVSLGTTVFTTAKLKLPDLVKEVLKPKATAGTFAEARLLYEVDLENDHTLATESKRYRRNCIAALLRTWPGLDGEKLLKIKLPDCKEWAKRFSGQYDEQFYNNTLGTFRAILERGGLGHDDNPARRIKRLGVKPKELLLPESAQFEALLITMQTSGAGQAHHCADLARFLAFSGCRISEARKVTWADVDFERGEIKVRNAKRSKVSNAQELRFVPVIPSMLGLLERLRRDQSPEPSDRVCILGECQKSLTRACAIVGIKRITHHDLRHLFATRCIEAGVDIPTVARWLGHSDGGALAMRVYGHLRREHSREMAQKVKF